MRWGVGAGASRLVSGTMTIHRRLEERLAAFERSEACVLFGSGYLANLGVIGALAGRGDTVFSDELNHASIVDGCRLSRAKVVVYRHRDIEHLDWSCAVTAAATRPPADRHRLGVLDGRRHRAAGGDRRARERARRAYDRRRGARDRRARAGRAGRHRSRPAWRARSTWSSARSARRSAPTARMRARAREMIRYLINTARSLIFSTAPPPPAIAGALAALELLEERPHRVAAAALPTHACCAARSTPRVCPWTDGEMHIVPLDRRRRARGDAPLPGGARARRVRPGDPPADGRRRAPRGCGWR